MTSGPNAVVPRFGPGAADLPTAALPGGEGHFYPSPHLTVGVPPIAPHRWRRNVDLLSIGYAFRPRLRNRLTLGGITFPRNPEAFGEQDSHLLYRYSFRHRHLYAPTPLLSVRLVSGVQRSPTAAAFPEERDNPLLRCHAYSRSFLARNYSASKLLRTF